MGSYAVPGGPRLVGARGAGSLRHPSVAIGTLAERRRHNPGWRDPRAAHRYQASREIARSHAGFTSGPKAPAQRSSSASSAQELLTRVRRQANEGYWLLAARRGGTAVALAPVPVGRHLLARERLAVARAASGGGGAGGRSWRGRARHCVRLCASAPVLRARRDAARREAVCSALAVTREPRVRALELAFPAQAVSGTFPRCPRVTDLSGAGATIANGGTTWRSH